MPIPIHLVVREPVRTCIESYMKHNSMQVFRQRGHINELIQFPFYNNNNKKKKNEMYLGKYNNYTFPLFNFLFANQSLHVLRNFVP